MIDFKTTNSSKRLSSLLVLAIFFGSSTQTLYPLQLRTVRFLGATAGIGVSASLAWAYINKRMQERNENKEKKRFSITKDDLISAGTSLLAGASSVFGLYWFLYRFTPFGRFNRAEQQMKRAKEKFDKVQSDKFAMSEFVDDNARRTHIKENRVFDDLPFVDAQNRLKHLKCSIESIELQLKQVSKELKKILIYYFLDASL